MARRTSKNSNAKKNIRKSQSRHSQTKAAAITPQRRVDILAILLLSIGLITLISLFTQTTGSFTGWWVENLKIGLGWGIFLVPVVLMPLSGWMLFRHQEKLPLLSSVRVIGIFLLFVNVIAWFHLFIDGNETAALLGRGGGYLGAAIKLGLEHALGKPGTYIILIAWLLIGMVLTIDFAMANLVRWVGSVFHLLINHIKVLIFTLKEKLHNKKLTHPESEIPQQVDTKITKPVPVVSTTAARVEGQSKTDQLNYDHAPNQPVWILPDPDEILDPAIEVPDNGDNDRQRARVIEETLRSFGAPAHVVDIQRGPSVTLFGVEPDFIESRNGKTRVRVSKISSLADDLALALAASRIRIQAPVPGKGYIGIEVPNHQISLVSLNEIMRSPIFINLDSPLKMALGKDVAGKAVATDLTSMPHLLIAGTTGAGKSVCINDILTCFLMNLTPDELRLVLVDPKRVELTGYNGIPHLLSPVIVDAEHVVGALQWITREMDIRYRKFSESQVRNIKEYNSNCEQMMAKKLPYLLVVIDELADLMMLAPDETERAITRLAQLARATGIHLIIATQRPSTDILTGLIKANFPARIAFAVASSVDSRVILDQPGAERLLGRGDMLFQAPDAAAPVRIQTAYVSDTEINRLTAYWRSFTVSPGAPERPDQSAAFQTNRGVPLKQVPLWEEFEDEKDLDPKFKEAVDIVNQESQASISMLQRKMRIGYTRAARMIDMMEEKGIVSKPDPKTQIREVLDTPKKDD